MRGFIKRLQHLILAVRYWPAKRKMERQIIVKLESAPVNEYMDFLLGVNTKMTDLVEQGIAEKDEYTLVGARDFTKPAKNKQ